MKRRFTIEKELENNFVIEQGNGRRWHRSRFRVLYADTDKAGPVYHANYLKYFEIGRAGLIRSSAHSYKEIETLGYYHPIVDLRVQYEAAAEYDDLLSVYARPAALHPVKFSYDYVVRNALTFVVDQLSVVVPVDPVTVAIFADFGIQK